MPAAVRNAKPHLTLRQPNTKTAVLVEHPDDGRHSRCHDKVVIQWP